MNDNMVTFLANLKHDIRNNQSVEVGSGIFKGQELVDVANALAAFPDLLEALELLLIVIDAPEDDYHIIRAKAAIAKAKGVAA